MNMRSICQCSQRQFHQQEEKQTMHQRCSLSIEINEVGSPRIDDQHSE